MSTTPVVPDSLTMLKRVMDKALDCDPQNIFFRCVEDSNEAIMLSDRKGVLIYVNPAWERIYGYSGAEAIGQTPRLIHSGMQSSDFYRSMWAQILDPARGSWKGELVNRAKDGTLVPVLLTITPFKSATGEIIGHMGLALDMTERKELEAKVAHQDRLASIGTLASGLAHEVGTPLGVVRGRAEFLMMKSGDNPEFIKNLDIIVSQIDRISRLIRSLLRISRGTVETRLAPVRPAAVAEEVLMLVGGNLDRESVTVERDIPGDLEALADFERLEQVLLNLVMNSIHAIRDQLRSGPEGLAATHRLRVCGRRDGEQVVLEVSDTGCGIPPENLRKLFQPFFSTKDVGEGTGLGLAIVSRLVREMKGEIAVRSALGKGTTFTLRFQAAK